MYGPANYAVAMLTAIVTGASSGIGRTFAHHLAQKHLNLVLVARGRQGLERVADECRAMGAGDVEVLPADLSQEEGIGLVEARLHAGDVHTLINNAGFSVGAEFADAASDALRGQLRVNVEAVLRLSHAALAPMTARGGGVLINVASVAGFLPGRGTTYSASKAWVTTFTEGLATDLVGTGVHVQALCPGFVRTGFHRSAGIDMVRTPEWLYVDVEHLVATSLREVGTDSVVCIPGGVYKAIVGFSRMLPTGLIRRVAAAVKSKGRD